ncbi:glycosyltransferase family 4 protein [Salininema proteolyticum]|uniref:Glycosyltransferase family 4 protein n=1 Tax=Salininema proteolyticum TaxID=1607685 RepID=A0ABV8U2H9_9ACTN
MKITFLIRNAYGVGGTIKTTLHTANLLAERGHDITVASLWRHRKRPQFHVSENVRLFALMDLRDPAKGGEKLGRADRARASKPSKTLLDGVNAMKTEASSALIDRRLAEFLKRHEADVVVGTHAGINLLLSQAKKVRALRVGQEHMYYDQYKEPVKDEIRRVYPALDAFVVLTGLDADDYRSAVPELAEKLTVIPNSVDRNGHERREEDPPFVMAAGRLSPVKRYSHLIRAFAKIGAEFPEWRLRLYGNGRNREKLEDLAAETDVADRIDFMGAVSPIEAEWAKASLAVSTSKMESFGMSLIEAMAAGTPVVSTRVKYGPMDFIEDGHNGLLVEPGDIDALAERMAEAMRDSVLRKELSENGREVARRFEPEAVIHEHEALFRRLSAQRPRRSGSLAGLFGRA